MTIITGIKKYIKRKNTATEKTASEAYDLWSATYDQQPGNLMLDLDEIIFNKLFDRVDIKNKTVADIGCGTGRHWEKIYTKDPAQLTGFDVSEGMLHKLKQKFPKAVTSHIADDLFKNVPDASFDFIISTLTVAHIPHIEQALNAWCRILKKDGEIIITDFHPELLAKGGRRTFVHNRETFAVTNYIHPLTEIKNILRKNGFTVHHEEERYIDEPVKSYYANQNALQVFEQFKGTRVIYGLHLKRNNAFD